ncbi:hypothetical protein [Falsiroseomonas sp. HW251]|uniref:hypothetical protein n=1 Tax=Falsiroseomonas sp. HW251 TaxID=3390998 RepID=UPI003D315129
MDADPVTRRCLLGAALAVPGLAARAQTAVPEAAELMAPGPDEGLAAGFAARAARGLARGLVQASALRVHVLGGPDGVTAANRFAASTAPDGRLLLVLPGAACQARMIGDSRARFDPGPWPAVTGSAAPAIVAGRAGPRGAPALRVALPGPASPEAAALLALEMQGRATTPVFLSGGVAPEAAVLAGAADAVVLTGRAVLVRAEALGLTPWFSLDGRDGTRDPAAPAVPGFGETVGPARPALVAAVRAAGAALRARGVLVLPALTSSDQVALWRAAARRWGAEEAEAPETGARRLAPEEAAELLATLCPAPEAMLAYRQWLRQRLGYQAG